MKILNPKGHGVLDYLAVIAFWLAPRLLGFAETPAAVVSYVVGTAQLLMSLATIYPLSLVKIIPFPVHGAIELIVSFGLAAAPWIFRFSDLGNARNFFVIAGLGLFLIWTMTNYQAANTTVKVHQTFQKEEYRKVA